VIVASERIAKSSLEPDSIVKVPDITGQSVLQVAANSILLDGVAKPLIQVGNIGQVRGTLGFVCTELRLETQDGSSLVQTTADIPGDSQCPVAVPVRQRFAQGPWSWAPALRRTHTT
jgi:hypothetical protein